MAGRKAGRRLWWLRTGQHLCRGLAGRAQTEDGYRTWWVRLPGGVVVWAAHRLSYEDIEVDVGVDLAPWVWAEIQRTRREYGDDG